MNILTLSQFDSEFLPLLKEKYRVHAILQRKSGMRAFETGLRVGTRIVRPLEYDFTKRTIIIKGKQGKKREVPIKYVTMEDVQKHYNQKKMPTYGAYVYAVKNAFDQMNFKPYKKPGCEKDMWTHCMRAYFILDWITRFGTTLADLQMLIGITGHKSINELQPYLDYMSRQTGIDKYHKELFKDGTL
jgi:site-specific recombinase XerD